MNWQTTTHPDILAALRDGYPLGRLPARAGCAATEQDCLYAHAHIHGYCEHCGKELYDGEGGYYDFDGRLELVHEDCVAEYARAGYCRKVGAV